MNGADICIGLQQFRPTVCRETVMLGRYPGRNQFLSLYILTKTGERRTAKQVASRLQQLRESCPNKECTSRLTSRWCDKLKPVYQGKISCFPVHIPTWTLPI